jgi:hypothetical protein
MAFFLICVFAVFGTVCGFVGYVLGFRRGKLAPVFRRAIPTLTYEDSSHPQIHTAAYQRAADSALGRTTGKRAPTEDG